ncbi:MAG TPA: DoxX family protein [Gemmatimonadaceae bacterium]|nr:DoxX family protein [Gemmatimonadaceae bacterium]
MKFQTIAYTLLRIVTPFLLLQHGVQKHFGLLGGFGPQHGTAELWSLFGAAGVIETFVTPFVLIGLFTRPAAFLVSGEMATAYFLMHIKNGFWPILNHGELPVLFCFVFLFISSYGPGPFSVDALLARRSGKPS